ncbi:hypothetical protein ACT7DA_21240 [Bacillus pacificus]
MPKVDGKYIPFGLATITVGEGADAIVFDGKNYFQADGGEINISQSSVRSRSKISGIAYMMIFSWD